METLDNAFTLRMNNVINRFSLQKEIIERILEETVHVDIFGCCVSRDVFGINPEGYKIELFLQNISPISVINEHYFHLVYSNFDLEQISPGFIKWQIAEINGTTQKFLNESPGNWLVLDFRPLSNPCSVISNENLVQIITETEYTPINVKLLRSNYPNLKINPFIYTTEDCYRAIDKFFKFIFSKYKDRIIYLELNECREAISNQGNIISLEPDNNRITLEREINNYIKNKYSNQLYYIEFPENTLADQCHPWGLYPVHMISEYYEYAKNSIDLIVSNEKNCDSSFNLSGALRQLKINYEKIINEITTGTRLSKYNARIRALNYIKCNNLEDAVSLANKMVQNQIYDGYAILGHVANHFSKPTLKSTAPEFYFAGMTFNSRYSRQCLYQYLKNKKKTKLDLVSILTYYAYRGDPEAMGELALLNKEKNIKNSKFWIKCAMDFGLSGFKKYSFDILWTNDDKNDYPELYNIASELAEKSDGEGFARLGLLYKRGIYVSKDLIKAEQYLRLAYNKKITWVEADLFDTLWEINDPSKYTELVDLAKKLSNNCNYEGCARLGLVYKYGRGVKQDFLKAENLFK